MVPGGAMALSEYTVRINRSDTYAYKHPTHMAAQGWHILQPQFCLMPNDINLCYFPFPYRGCELWKNFKLIVTMLRKNWAMHQEAISISWGNIEWVVENWRTPKKYKYCKFVMWPFACGWEYLKQRALPPPSLMSSWFKIEPNMDACFWCLQGT
jgi:hypothetical protein